MRARRLVLALPLALASAAAGRTASRICRGQRGREAPGWEGVAL